jgi:hypothetical protein
LIFVNVAPAVPSTLCESRGVAMTDDRRIEFVRVRAYHIWENSGRPIGQDLDHWLQAEFEFLAANAAKGAAPKRNSVRAAAAKAPKRTRKAARTAPRA